VIVCFVDISGIANHGKFFPQNNSFTKLVFHLIPLVVWKTVFDENQIKNSRSIDYSEKEGVW
jgi:hypothetical protein